MADVLLATSRQRMAQPENDHPSKPDDLTFVLFRPRISPARSLPKKRAARAS